MVEPEVLRATPGDRARAAADALGDDVLTDWCADLLAGRATWGDPELPDIGWVGGQVVSGWGSPDHLDDDTRYWTQVWAARTLLYVWADGCASDVVAGLADPAWRVREMSAKVAARWEVGSAADPCADLVTTDEVPRVRAAAARVLGAVGEAEHAAALHEAVDDQDESVRVAAARALGTLERRLDRTL
ncbi:MAG: HEAT repeat domain-containing protein [Terrabacter sp.]|nr:HEAT repeat domain-containing protein [Terrabacter sp.]